jgi:outer membrane protein, multidrug efflux system
MMRHRIAVLTLAGFVTGCAVGPNYKRPDVPAPPQFRGAETAPAVASLGELKWFDLFQDEALRKLIQQALAANYNVLIAAQRVEEAQGQFQATRSAMFPQLNAQGVAARQGTGSPTQSVVGGFGAASWEIDLFGKIRRATEAAKADLLATKDNQAAITIALVSQVATAYFQLLEYDAELQYVRESLVQRHKSADLVKARLEGGVGSKLDYDQALSLVYSAEASAALLEKGIEQTENQINFLLAKPPGPVERGKILTEQYQPPQVPAGLPSALLDRRPDIRASEQQLVASNARVGVAKAAFFPSITLTAAGGYQSADLLGVVNRAGFAYSMGGTVDLPIFDAGRRQGNYKTAKAYYQEILVNYQGTVNGAFHDVSDSLIGYQKAKQYRVATQQFTETLRDQSHTANLRYVGGVSSYLEVLDTERQRLTGEQQLAQAQRDELLALVQLYKSLGGGWQI